jgi:MFS superfamily sulfate permease-like transporter
VTAEDRTGDGGSLGEGPSGIARWIPGLRAVRTYDRQWTRSDLVAGVVLAAILVPQGLAHAELAGLPPVTGLYTSIGCLVGYAVFGPSKILVLGPDSSISPPIFAALLPLLAAGGDVHRAIALAGMLAIIVAVIEIGLGIGKLGFVADLLSSEVQVGYMNGLALIIIVGQLPKLFGFSTDAEGFGPELKAFAPGLSGTVGAALVVGLGVLAILLTLSRFTKVVPAVLVGIVAATVVSAIFDLHAHGVSTVGTLPRGVPAPAFPWTKWADVGPLAVAAVGITLVSLADTIATSSSFGARRGEEVDPNQEMIGIGAANLAAGLSPGIRGVDQRVAHCGRRAGRGEASAGLFGRRRHRGRAAVVLQLPAGRPSAVGPGRCADRGRIVPARSGPWSGTPGPKERPGSLRGRQLGCHRVRSPAGDRHCHCSCRASVLPPQLATPRRRPRRSGEPEGLARRREIPRCEGAAWDRDLPMGGPSVFANCSAFRAQIRQVVRERHAMWVIVHSEAMTDIDVSAARTLEQLDRELNAVGIHMAFVEMRARLQDLVRRYGLFETLDRDRFYPTIEAAITAVGEA